MGKNNQQSKFNQTQAKQQYEEQIRCIYSRGYSPYEVGYAEAFNGLGVEQLDDGQYRILFPKKNLDTGEIFAVQLIGEIVLPIDGRDNLHFDVLDKITHISAMRFGLCKESTNLYRTNEDKEKRKVGVNFQKIRILDLVVFEIFLNRTFNGRSRNLQVGRICLPYGAISTKAVAKIGDVIADRWEQTFLKGFNQIQ